MKAIRQLLLGFVCINALYCCGHSAFSLIVS